MYSMLECYSQHCFLVIYLEALWSLQNTLFHRVQYIWFPPNPNPNPRPSSHEQGVVTTIPTVLTPATGIKIWSSLFWALIAWFLLEDSLDCLIFTKNIAWWLDWCQKLPLISWPIYSLLRWMPTFYSIRRSAGSKCPVTGVSTAGIVVTTPWRGSLIQHRLIP